MLLGQTVFSPGTPVPFTFSNWLVSALDLNGFYDIRSPHIDWINTLQASCIMFYCVFRTETIDKQMKFITTTTIMMITIKIIIIMMIIIITIMIMITILIMIVITMIIMITTIIMRTEIHKLY